MQEYGAKALASRLRLSLRALQREVSRHGTTVRALLDEARCAQAKRLLQDRRLSVDEIAFVLSYSDERAFRRAFKRMTGESPAQFRRRQSLS
ncbi:MAG: helix-turn-helix domain-containing protein [Deltaproteobacteria bacterium]